MSPTHDVQSLHEEVLRLRREIAVREERETVDRVLAAAIHRSLITPRYSDGRIQGFTRFLPAESVGGDYTTIFPRDDGKVFCCISDVCGHGVASALLATRVSSHVRYLIPRIEDPCQLGRDLNSFLIDHFTTHLPEIFITFFCVCLDLERGTLTYAGFGHPPSLLLRPGRTSPRRLSSTHSVLGVSEHVVEDCHTERLPIAAGTRILLYTDGLQETHGRNAEMFGIQRIEAIFAESPPGRAPDRLIEEAARFRTTAQLDDVTVVELVVGDGVPTSTGG